MTLNLMLIGLLALLIVLGYLRQRDESERIELAKREVQRIEQSRCQVLVNNSFVIYRKAMQEAVGSVDDLLHHKHEEEENET